MKVLHSTDNKLKIKIKSDSVLLNTFRRIIMSEIPSIAIDMVHIFQNESPVDDNNLSHRIGMIPLLGKVKNDFKLAKECTCELECESCSIFFYLDITNYDDEVKEVTSDDFTNSNGFHFLPNILICHLAPKATLHVKVKGILGYGKDHVKWSQVSVPTFYPYPKLSLRLKKDDVSVPFSNVVEYRPSKVSKVVCDFSSDVSRCYDLDGKILQIPSSAGNVVTAQIFVEPEPSVYIFSFETIKTNNAKETFHCMHKTLRQKIYNLKHQMMSISKNDS